MWRQKLSLDAPGCFWTKGDTGLLELPKIALVGSRDIDADHLNFAKEVGRQAALQGFALVSGNARGADRAAQDACLQAGGCVISVVADELQKQKGVENVLYVSEDGFDEVFFFLFRSSKSRRTHLKDIGIFNVILFIQNIRKSAADYFTVIYGNTARPE